jgi:hypothetical protein
MCSSWLNVCGTMYDWVQPAACRDKFICAGNGIYSVELPPESRRRKVEDRKHSVGMPVKFRTAVRN